MSPSHCKGPCRHPTNVAISHSIQMSPSHKIAISKTKGRIKNLTAPNHILGTKPLRVSALVFFNFRALGLTVLEIQPFQNGLKRDHPVRILLILGRGHTVHTGERHHGCEHCSKQTGIYWLLSCLSPNVFAKFFGIFFFEILKFYFSDALLFKPKCLKNRLVHP